MKSEQEVIDLLKANPETGVCRLCLVENDGNFESLHSSQGINTYSEKLKHIFLEDFDEFNRLPLCICGTCSINLSLVHELLTKWRETQKILMKYYLSTKDKSDENFYADIKDDELKKEEDWGVDDSVPQESEVDVLKLVKLEDDDDNVEMSRNECDYVETKQRQKKTKKKMKSYKTKKEKKLKEESSVLITPDMIVGDRIICKICEKPLKSEKTLVGHMEKMHSEARYKKVGKVTGYGADRRYHCMYCDHAAKNTRSLNGHIRVHTGEKPYVCDVCTKQFTTHAGLYQHRFIHSDVMNFTCAHCGKQFNSKRKHERHQLVHQEKNFICDICKKPLKSKPTLIAHIVRHTNVRNFSCETCGAAFFSNSELHYHLKTHLTGIKRFKCNICKFSTNTKAHLDIHIRRHSGERPFECTICPLRCYTKGLLKVHMRSHTKEKMYPCSVCPKMFGHSSTLNRHMLRSHGMKYKWNDQVDRRVIK